MGEFSICHRFPVFSKLNACDNCNDSDAERISSKMIVSAKGGLMFQAQFGIS